MPRDLDMMDQHSYSLCYVDPATEKVIPVAAEYLAFNEGERRLNDCLTCMGFFLVEVCGKFTEVFSKDMGDFGISTAKEGILKNEWEDNNILEGHPDMVNMIV